MKKDNTQYLLCYRLILFVCLIFPIQLLGCKGNNTLERVQSHSFVLDTIGIQQMLRNMAKENKCVMYADRYVQQYLDTVSTFLWISEDGLNPQVKILLENTRNPKAEGLSENFFGGKSLRTICDSINNLSLRKNSLHVDTLMAKVEYLLTRTLMRSVLGRSYGYLQPKLFMNKLVKKGKNNYCTIFDMPVEEPTDSIAQGIINAVHNQNLKALMATCWPKDSLYHLLSNEMQRAKKTGNKTRLRLARINMERARWRYDKPLSHQRYVFVNLAGSMLTAVSPDTSFNMRICQGTQSNRTPLLKSKLTHMELNPYWVIPYSIICNEIIKYHLGDTHYFQRNRIHAILQGSTEELDPSQLSEKQLRSGAYKLRQAKGQGNSLGRMVFRFTNKFQVFLHDTNNRGAFQKANRTLSHGCIRLQRPLDFAFFLLADKAKDPLYADRIRMSIDLPPLSKPGKAFKQKNPNAKSWSYLSFETSTPLWLDYYTLFPDPTGKLCEYSDTYGYDTEIEKLLDKL